MIAAAPMGRADDPVVPANARVLLFTPDQFKGQSYVASLENAAVPVELVTTASALRSRLERVDLPQPALVMVLPSQQASMPPGELARVVLRLTSEVGRDNGPQKATSALLGTINDYCSMRSLSQRQRQVLELYLVGNNDKEIAWSFKCAATTVYEHWRRMAKKANGTNKSDVVNDFHRFLATRSGDEVSPSLLASRGRAGPRSDL